MKAIEVIIISCLMYLIEGLHYTRKEKQIIIKLHDHLCLILEFNRRFHNSRHHIVRLAGDSAKWPICKPFLGKGWQIIEKNMRLKIIIVSHNIP